MRPLASSIGWAALLAYVCDARARNTLAFHETSSVALIPNASRSLRFGIKPLYSFSDHLIQHFGGDQLEPRHQLTAQSHHHFTVAPRDGLDNQPRTLLNGHKILLRRRRLVLFHFPRSSKFPRMDGSVYWAGGNHQHVHAVFLELNAQRVAKALQSMFGSSVTGGERKASFALPRRNGDHQTAPGLEMRQRLMYATHYSQVIDLHQALKDRKVAYLIKANTHRNARIVNEDIQPAEARHCLLNEMFAIFRFCDIGLNSQYLRSLRLATLQYGIQLSLIARGQHKIGPLGRQRYRQRFTDAFGSTGEDHRLVFHFIPHKCRAV